MNKLIYSCLFICLILFSKTNCAQTFWTETFGTGCNQASVANGAVPTGSNGAWSVANIGLNDPSANEWFVSATENGNAVNACGSGCGTNKTLHIANVSTSPNSFFCPSGDCGAAYDAGFGANDVSTDKRCESPVINCTGQTNISLSFKYMTEGDPGFDFAEVHYFDGVVWNTLSLLAPTANGICFPQGLWTAFTIALPPSANNNPNVRVGFRWVNNDDAIGTDPSIAVDDVILFKPAATLTVTTASTVCANQNIAATLTGTTLGTTSFVWATNPGGAVISGTTALGTTATINYTAAGVYTVVVVGLVGVVPTYSATQTVTVSPGPAVAVVPASQTICAGGTATLTANATTGSTYQWASGTFPAITVLGTNSVQTSSPLVNTTYTVVASIGSCTAFATASVVIGANLTITGSASPTAACPGAAVVLSALGATSYTWVAPPSSTLAGNTSSQGVNPLVATTYSVYGANGACTGSTTISVGISASISLTITSTSATTCPGQPVTLTANGAVNYTWSPGSTLSSTSGTMVNASPTVATTYVVVGDNGAGCTGTTNITIAIGSGAPSPPIASSNSVCAGFTSTISASASGATSYTFAGTGLGIPINQPSISVGPGVYTYTLSSGAGCNLVGSITIYTQSPLNISVLQPPGNFTTCIASNYPKYSQPVYLNPTGASTYVWSVYNPYTMSGSLSAIYVRPPTSTCYTVTGTTAVCSGSAVVCVTVIPQFTMSVIPKQPIMCLGDSLVLNITNIGTLSVLPITNYVWYDPLPPSISNPFDPTVTITPTTTCTYSVEIYDSRACVSLPRLVTVTVLPQPLTAVSIPTINGLATNTVCFVGNQTGPDINLVLTSSSNNPPIPGVVPTYTWIPPYQNPINPILTPSVLTGPGSVVIAALQFTPTGVLSSTAAIQTYTVISGYNGIPGCRRVDTVSIRAIDCRSVTIASVHFTTAVVNDTICSKDCVTFLNQSDTASGGPQTYEWTFFGGAPPTSTLQSPTVCYNLPSPPGGYWVRLKVCNPYAKPNGSCAMIAKNGFIKVVDVPNTTIVPPGQLQSTQYIRFGEKLTMISSGARTYVWEPNYKITSLTSPTVVVNPLMTTQYIVTGYNSKGCMSKDTVNVIVIDDCGEMYVPNAFSPNGDGVNDVLYVRGLCLETLNFMVFNRWGEKVFETTDINKGWDGTYKGEAMNTSVFVYRLEGKTYDGKGFSSKGNVTLVR